LILLKHCAYSILVFNFVTEAAQAAIDDGASFHVAEAMAVSLESVWLEVFGPGEESVILVEVISFELGITIHCFIF
jgi:hypothetical protein